MMKREPVYPFDTTLRPSARSSAACEDRQTKETVARYGDGA